MREVFRTVLHAILIECEKENISNIRDIAQYTLDKLDGKIE